MKADIRELPGWNKVDTRAQMRILAAAKKYIIEKSLDDTANWFGSDTLPWPAIAGYRAIRLVYMEDINFIRSLTSVHWKNWSPVVLSQPISLSMDDELIIHHEIIKLTYESAPDQVISDLLKLIDKENEKHSNVYILRYFKGCWDARLGESVLNKLKTQSLMPESMKCILNELLIHQIKGTEDYAKSLISPQLLDDKQSRTAAIISANVLLRNSIGWKDIIWPLKATNPVFLHDVILTFSSNFERYYLIQNLSEMELADLYIWLVNRFPYQEDPNHDDDEMAHFVGPREEVTSFRDEILRYLSNKGTMESCDQLARIVSELPELPWLKWTLFEAQDVTRRKTWSPPSPIDIIKLVGTKRNRLVQREEQLLEVLIESLGRLEQKLHGITPEVIWLWNETDKRKYRPRSENEFSDYLKQHLERDLVNTGIVVNREVEIRRSTGSLPGERTDIHVNAILLGDGRGAAEIITIIIEVKGNWHEQLFQAMETQLVDRYLKDAKCKYGLYLIGWFESVNWDASDRRKTAIPSGGLEKTKRLLNDQARRLSKRGIEVKSFVLNAYL
ncbi:hypothetical protein GE107_06945 [Cohnella sp. CFH 77786]|uniref:hypothetical protein n=1 Tax=Cohnella sp. CFH 77786 TaxID=2662265 RepID=UPI001C610814|nr:hypothetical protein [Cohnella sp. CFH 77786]MBW5445797.1 hypothetical protein [Cohnella sp. CFH 77786]